MPRPRSGTDSAVLTLLQGSATPLTAYQVLDALRPQGVQSPPVVYRALERLERSGQVHRLERLNAYFACHGHPHKGEAVFALCRCCGRVEEWESGEVDAAIARGAGPRGFAVETRTVELRGLCAACATAPSAHQGPCGHHHHD
jgi:Fur family zinc uptake transcriptional regulator